MSQVKTSSAVEGPSTARPLAEHEMDARFIEHVTPYLHLLACSARRHTHNPRDAEDLFQETLLKAYLGFHTFREGSNLKAWLFQIMKRTAIDVYRATQRRPAEVLTGQFTDSLLFGGVRYSTHVSPSAETEMLDANLGEELRQALLSLTEPLRIVVYYADVEGRTYRDIATILNIPMGTVMSRIHRARQRLRTQLTDTADAGGCLPLESASSRERTSHAQTTESTVCP